MSKFDYMNALGKRRIPFFFMVDFEMENLVVRTMDELEGIFFDINGKRNHEFKYENQEMFLRKKRIPFMEYKKAFDEVLRELNYGNSFLLNLTWSTEVEMDHSLWKLFLNTPAKYKLYYHNELVLFSPEPFVKIKDHTIASFPMKGTINTNIPGAAEKLLNNEKEKAEHFTIVDLIRNDLSMVSENVRVSKLRYLEKIETQSQSLYQLSSKIEGDIDEDWHENIGHILQTLLPAGSISGAPKKKTVDIISRIEKEKRGYYTGIMGIFDGFSLDSGVMIRFIEKRDRKYYYRSGGGITFQSDVNSEYSELLDKIYVPVSGNY